MATVMNTITGAILENRDPINPNSGAAAAGWVTVDDSPEPSRFTAEQLAILNDLSLSTDEVTKQLAATVAPSPTTTTPVPAPTVTAAPTITTAPVTTPAAPTPIRTPTTTSTAPTTQNPGVLASPLSQGFTVEQVEKAFKAGGTFQSDAEVIAILQQLGVAFPQDLMSFWRAGGSGTNFGPAIPDPGFGAIVPQPRPVDVGDAPVGAVPPPFPFVSGAPGPGGSQFQAGPIDPAAQRARLFASQSPADLERRLIANAFGSNLTPLLQRAAQFAFSRFSDVEPLLNPGGQLSAAEAFPSFLSNPPGSAGLETAIGSLLAANQPGTPGATAFNTRFPTPNAAFTGGIQPFLANVTPRLRGAFAKTLQDEAFARFAQTPEQFQSPEQRAAIFGDLRDRGFLNF